MHPFEKKVPSVFAVSSPFQILCAIAAIRQLEIEDYIMVVVFHKGGLRDNQMECLLKKYEINYRRYRHFNRFTYSFTFYKALFSRNNHYKRLFIGDFRDILNCYVGCGLVSDHSDIVYLDDGNITISLLRVCRDSVPCVDEKNAPFLKRISESRGFLFFKNLLTIYGDIPNESFNIGNLSLDRIVNDKCSLLRVSKGIYIVGTNSDCYCLPLKLDENKFINYIDKLIGRLKLLYPQENIYYISHGAEYKHYAEELCEKNGIFFRRPTAMIEMDLLSFPNVPKAIYGFTSSALFNLKKLFPTAIVVNILFKNNLDNPFFLEYHYISDYYQKNGIELVEEEL